jgi:hypothetical protein
MKRTPRSTEGAHLVELGLADGIVLVVVALCAINGQAEKPFADVFYSFLEPLIAIEQIVIPGQVTCGAQLLQVIWVKLVGGQHELHHFIVRCIRIE